MLVASSERVKADVVLSSLAGGFVPLWMPALLLLIGLAVGLSGSLLSLRRALAVNTTG